jgi:hypothetical protein
MKNQTAIVLLIVVGMFAIFGALIYFVRQESARWVEIGGMGYTPEQAAAIGSHPVIADTASTREEWERMKAMQRVAEYRRTHRFTKYPVPGGNIYVDGVSGADIFVPDPPKPTKPCECEPYRVYPFHPIDPGICPVPDLPKWKDHLMLQDTISLQNLRGLHLYDTINGRSNLWIKKDTIK